MEIKKFSYSQVIKYGFTKTVDNFGLFAKLMLLFIAMFLLLCTSSALIFFAINGNIGSLSSSPIIFAFILLFLMFLIISTLFGAGYIKIALKLYDNEETQVNDVFIPLNIMVRYMTAMFLYGLLMAMGFVLFIIPGFMFLIRYIFVPYLIVDKNMSIGESFSESAKLTQGSRMQIFWFWLLVTIITMIINKVTLGLGSLITGPFLVLVFTYIYRHLDQQLPIEMRHIEA